MQKFNPNVRNPREAGLSCIHKACISPSLTILTDLLKDSLANAMTLDNLMKTAAQRAPKIYLTSFKMAIRHERKHFIRNAVQSACFRPGRFVAEHEMDEDPSVLEFENSNRSIPLEVSGSAKVSVADRIKISQTTTSIKNSHLFVGKAPLSVQGNSLLETHKGGFSISRFSAGASKAEVDCEDVRLEVPISRPTLGIRKDTVTHSLSVSSKFIGSSTKKIDDSMAIDSLAEPQYSPDLALLRRKLMDQLQTPVTIANLREPIILEQPLAQKVRSYCNYGSKFNQSSNLQVKNPFLASKNHTNEKSSDQRPSQISISSDHKDNTSLIKIELQDKIGQLLNYVRLKLLRSSLDLSHLLQRHSRDLKITKKSTRLAKSSLEPRTFTSRR